MQDIGRTSYVKRGRSESSSYNTPCGLRRDGLGLHYIRHILAFAFAIEEINQSNLLPNITLGFQAHDSGPSEALTIERSLRILSGGRKVVENFSCGKQGKIVAFIGHLLSSPTDALADILSVYNYVQISYGALDTVFDDETLFGKIFRTVPSEHSLYKAIIQLLKQFNWSWVGIVTDESNVSASEEIKVEIIRSGFCVEFMKTIKWKEEDTIMEQIHKSTLRHYMQRVMFTTEFGEVFFDDEGNIPGYFEILNFIVHPNTSPKIVMVGTFRERGSSGEKLRMKTGQIQWNPYFIQSYTNKDYYTGKALLTFSAHEGKQIPQSVCSKSCSPGYRKAVIKGSQICCYNCVQCSEGEITNATDMTSCSKCPEDQWSNEKMDSCVPKEIEFLSFHHILGITLTVTSVLFCILAIGISVIIFNNRHMQIVRANNTTLSYILLLCLILSFLCGFLFIGEPGSITCLLRQISFGLIFAMALSTILGKTVTVIIAFNATKPGSKLNKLVGTKVSKMIVLSTSLGQVSICSVWLICSPPFPDAVSEMGKIVLQCNEGSVVAFYIMVGYIGGLAFVSFALAYFTRTLPDIYNEAQLITFSMLVFCSVWISFIPAYLSTKGKYMVAVELFTILASSAGLLGCIFFPKCFIILKHKLHKSNDLKSTK
ncbi:vomeronasal type-2 receptor 26-like [Engystomops pustulosus]|uniref:vomeronasal type-2 receptor 26-like n=1 Tax=Engystomops pustulosus TaxID=76066 RepID=UPI003AFB21B5